MPISDGQDSLSGGAGMGRAGHVAALGTPNRRQYIEFDGHHDSYMLSVYVCSPHLQGWDTADLDEFPLESVDHPWERELERFFARETEGVSLFTGLGAIPLNAPGMDWGVTMADLYEDAAAGGESACDKAAKRDAAEMVDRLRDGPTDPLYAGYSPPILLLVDVPTGGVAGFATYGGIARVSYQLDNSEMPFVIAHELGHSLFHLPHTDEAEGSDCDDDEWALMRSNARCLSPPMGPNGLLDYEITCAERRLFEWRCRHEPLHDAVFDNFYNHWPSISEIHWESAARRWDEAITVRPLTEEEIAKWREMPKYPGREDEPPPTTTGTTLADLKSASWEFGLNASFEAKHIEEYLDLIVDHPDDPRNTSDLGALADEAALWRRIEEVWKELADVSREGMLNGAPADLINWSLLPKADFPIPPLAEQFAHWTMTIGV